MVVEDVCLQIEIDPRRLNDCGVNGRRSLAAGDLHRKIEKKKQRFIHDDNDDDDDDDDDNNKTTTHHTRTHTHTHTHTIHMTIP